jgi:EAL and modified HD-GYP domain-containing signal transduction protein
VQLPGTPLARRGIAGPRPFVPSVAGGAEPGPEASAWTPAEATVHRSPVVLLDGRTLGYSVRVDAAPGVDEDAVYLDLDLASLVADRYAFLPATPAMLDGFVPTPVVPGRLVLDLPVGFAATPSAPSRATALRALGVALSLVDYRAEPAQQALLPYLSFVVVDPTLGEALPSLVHAAHQAGVRVLARDVASTELLDACRAAGVDGLRGGYALQLGAGVVPTVPTQRPGPGAPAGPAPAGSGTRVLRAGEAQCLTILDLLMRPEPPVAEIAQVIETDPVLTLRVLHLVNSGAYALAHQVDTVRQAVVLLGPAEVSTLVTALALDARPDAMDRLWFILARAMTCEALADDSTAYTVGMLSALAEQLAVPAEVLLEKVGVSAVVADAIVDHAGPFGPVLEAVRRHEGCDVEGVLAVGYDPVTVSGLYQQCLRDALAIARTVTRTP